MPSCRHRRFQVGDWSVDAASGRIGREGESHTLRPKEMALLVCLAERQGEVVSRDDIVERVWGGLAISDDALYFALCQLRRALGDDRHKPVFIETSPKRGYRLIAPVRTAGGAGGPSGAPSDSRILTLRRAFLASGLGAGLVLAAGGLALRKPGHEPAEMRHVEALIALSENALRSGLPESGAQGESFLEEAVTIRPDHARAWGKLALARVMAAEYAPPDRVAAAVAGVQEAAGHALALDPRQVDALCALAILPPTFGDWLAAERRMLAVLEVDPDHLPTRDALAYLRVGVGRLHEGCLERLAIAPREPLHAVHQFRLVYANWLLGRIEEADRAADRALRLWPQHPAIWCVRLWTLAFTERAQRALALFEDGATRPDFPPWMIETLHAAIAALASRRRADIVLAVESVLADLARGPSQSVSAILLLAGLGEIDLAFDVAHAYYLERGPLPAKLRQEPGQPSINDHRSRDTHPLFTPVTAPMRADRRFLPLVRDLGLETYWQQTGVTPDFLM